MNIAAKIVTKTPRREHISPVLYHLHWLPVEKRVVYKKLLITFRAYHQVGPEYLNELIVRYVPTRTLRSLDSQTLVVSKVNSKIYGERAFAFAGPRLWNSLPSDIKATTSYGYFKTHLKTYLFRQISMDNQDIFILQSVFSDLNCFVKCRRIYSHRFGHLKSH